MKPVVRRNVVGTENNKIDCIPFFIASKDIFYWDLVSADFQLHFYLAFEIQEILLKLGLSFLLIWPLLGIFAALQSAVIFDAFLFY